MCKNLIKTLAAVFLVIIFIITSSAATMESHDLKNSSLDLEGTTNSTYQITGKTYNNYISLLKCENISLIFSLCNINLSSTKAIMLKNSTCNLIFEHDTLVRSPICIELSNSSIFFKQGNVVFDGTICLRGKSKLSISKNASFCLVSKTKIDLNSRYLETGNNLSSILCIELNEDSIQPSPNNIYIKNTIDGNIKNITLPANYRSFAISLPEGSYTIYTIDNNGNKNTLNPEEIQVSGFKICRNVGFSKYKKLVINNVELYPPSKYKDKDGKIVVNVSGGSGNYRYTLDWVTGEQNTFKNLSAGNYTLNVEDTITHESITKKITIEEPFSIEIKKFYLNGKELPTQNGVLNYKATVPSNSITANIVLELEDARASYQCSTDLNGISLLYGRNTIPVKVSSGNLDTTYSIIINRMPPAPQSNIQLDKWYPSPFTARFLANEDGCKIAYNINGSEFIYGNHLEVQQSGIHIINTYAEIDGVKSDESVFRLKLDSTPPIITSAKIERNELGKFECTVFTQDAHSGVDYITYFTEKSKKEKIRVSGSSVSFILDDDYMGDIAFTATDHCGNTSDAYVLKDVVIDNQKPHLVKMTPDNSSTADALSFPMLEFSEDIILGTGSVYISENNNEPVKLDKSQIFIEKNVAVLHIPLSYESQYKISIDSDAFTDKAYNNLDFYTPFKWYFSTPVSPNDSSLSYLNLDGKHLGFTFDNQYYSSKIKTDNNISLNVIPKNSKSSINVSLYSSGKLVKNCVSSREYEFLIEKNALKYNNKRIIISVTSQNGYNTTNYAVDLISEDDVASVINNSPIKNISCFELNKADNLSSSIPLDKLAHFSLRVDDVTNEKLPHFILTEIEKLASFSNYFAVDININKVINNISTELVRFSPVMITMGLNPNQNIYKVNEGFGVRSTFDSISLLQPIEDLDTNPNTVSFPITKGGKFIIISSENESISRPKRIKKDSSKKRAFFPQKDLKNNAFIMGVGECITAEKLHALLENNIPIVLKINGKDILLNDKNIPYNFNEDSELTYKDILSAFSIDAKTENPPTGY